MIRKFRHAIVTGGAGFIGSHLSKYLISKGIKVTVIDNFSTGSESNLKSIRTKITLVNCDISDNSIDDYFQNVDVVFNCAAIVGVKLATSKPLEVLDQNISNVRKILDLCRKNNALHIFISSSEVYGNSLDMPVSENSVLVPVSPYGLSKIVGETYCSSFKRKYTMPFNKRIQRPSTCFMDIHTLHTPWRLQQPLQRWTHIRMTDYSPMQIRWKDIGKMRFIH